MSEKTQAQQTLEALAQEVAAAFRTYKQKQLAIASDKRLSEPAKRGDLAKLTEEFGKERAAIEERAAEALAARRGEIGPLAATLNPASASTEELLLRERLKEKALRQIQPRLDAAAKETDPWRLLEELKELGQRAVAEQNDVLADVLREEYEWLIPLDTWGLDKSQARQVPRIYREELDKVLEPLTPPSERTKREQHAALDRGTRHLEYTLAALAEALASDQSALVITDFEGHVQTVDPGDQSAA